MGTFCSDQKRVGMHNQRKWDLEATSLGMRSQAPAPVELEHYGFAKAAHVASARLSQRR